MAEKKVIELEVKSDSLGSLKSQLRAAQNEVNELAAKFGATSQEAIGAAKRAAELKDAIGDAKALTDSFNPDGKFNALSASIGGALNGFQAFEGALGLVGVESEDLQKTLLKVQSAMALSQGVQGLLEAKDSFKQLGAVAMDALKGIRTGLLLTGIGVFTVALGVVIAYWDDIRKAVGAVSEEEKKLAEFRKQYAAEQDKQVADESKGFATLIAQLKASNKGSKERSELITEINKKYGTTLKNLSDEAEFQNQLNQELANYLTYQQAKFRLQKNEEAIVKNLETQSKLKRELAQAEKDLTKAIEEGAGKTRTTSEEGVRVQVAVNQEASNAAERAGATIKKNQKELEEAEKRFENYGKAAIYASGQIDKLTYSGKKYVEQNTETTKSTEKATKTVVESKQNEFELTEEIEEGLRQQLIDSEAAKDKTRQEGIAKQEEDELALMQFKGDIYKQDVDNTFKAEEEKQLARQKTVDLALKTAQTFAKVYGELNNLLNASDNERLKNVKKGSKEEEAIKKRMFERDKKLRIVQTIIDTASNVVTSVRNGGGIPTGIPFGVAAGVMGALQIAAISKTKFEGSSGGGGGDTAVPQIAGEGGVMSPNFNLVGNAQATNPLAGLGEGIIQAYVVSGDVTTAQSLDRNRVNNATFG